MEINTCICDNNIKMVIKENNFDFALYFINIAQGEM